MVKTKYEKYPRQFDEEIIATKKPRKPKQKSYQAYILALELRRQGLSERKIKTEIEKRLGEKVSVGTVHYWVTGKIVK